VYDHISSIISVNDHIYLTFDNIFVISLMKIK